MKVKVQQGNEEINSIGGILLVGRLFNSLKNLSKADNLQMGNVKIRKIIHSLNMIEEFGIGRWRRNLQF